MKRLFFALCLILCCIFAAHSQENLQKHLQEQTQDQPHLQEWTREKILLSDDKKLLELKDTFMVLRYNLNYPFSVRWACMLALARIGEKSAIDEILSKVSSKETDSRMIYIYYPDLIYTHQKKLYDFLIERMMDKRAQCNSANPNSSVKIDCGYRIVEILAPAIKDFPQRSESKNIKKWLSKSRKWCKKQNGKYRIIDK